MNRFIPAVYAQEKEGPKKVVFGIPLPKGQDPYPQTVQALKDCLPLVEAAGFEHAFTYTSGNPYISGARAEITRKALDADADLIVYIDYDVSWEPKDMVSLLTTAGDVVGGTYRCKVDDESKYMGAIHVYLDGPNEGKAIVRADGAIKARALPAGFLKVTTSCIDKFMRSYPELCYGPQYSLSVDLFHHGAYEGIWWGEDYAFCRNWEACGGECWLIPNMNIDHWQIFGEGYKVYEGNYHDFLMRQPGANPAQYQEFQERYELSKVAV